jgi:CTP synthase (UTP-ammonia lyase)
VDSDKAHIALIGDHDPKINAHKGIAASIQSLRAQGWPLEVEWIAPRRVGHLVTLSHFHGFWCVPGTPYSDTEKALNVIGHARQHGVPFLGTCGGFQHAILEYSRNVLGIAGAGHEELDPDAQDLVVSRLSCSMVEVSGSVKLNPASKIAAFSGTLELEEGYHCNFGLNPGYAGAFDGSPLRFVGHDDEGEPRVFELQGHPFFIGTLFQPERAVLTGRGVHPLIAAFAAVVVGVSQQIRIF